MEPFVSKINTQRLKPLCQRTTRTVMSILENGDISMEILAKPQYSSSQEGSQMVQEMVHISGDGTKVQLYQNNQGDAGNEGKGAKSSWEHQEFIFPNLPPKQLKKYIHVYRFIELVKSKTPKVILTTDRAKCKLMENLPAPDFQVDFHDGMSIQLSKGKVHVTDSDGNSSTADVNQLSHSFSEVFLERYIYSKQCESECLRLVDSFNSLKTNGCSTELFPISIGTNTSPVLVPPSQQTTPSDNTLSSNIHQSAFLHDRTHLINEAYLPCGEATAGISLEVPHSTNVKDSSSSIPAQLLDPQLISLEKLTQSKANACQQQQLYDPSHFTLAHMMYTVENTHFYPSQFVESNSTEFEIPPNYTQSNLLNIDNGANISNTMSDLPQACQSSLGQEDKKENGTYSYSHHVDYVTIPRSTTQQTNNCAQIYSGKSLSEGYNKFKYCSMTPRGRTDQEELCLQQECLQEEFLPEHLDMSGLRVTEKENVPCQCNCTQLADSNNAGNFQAEGVTQATILSIPSLSDVSSHSQTFSSFASSNNKSNVIVTSLASNSSSIVENSSPHNKTELVNTSNNPFSFTPIQSSSIVTPFPDLKLSESPKKDQRKALSLDLSAALENQMKSLDLNSSRSDSMNGGTPQSAGSEKYIHSTQNMLLKNTPRNISFNSSFSTNKISDRFRVRQDQLNSSLPLSCDSRNYGLSNIPATPQKQFLQSSDTSLEQGQSEFGLPPQVRHSLDLSTSSNYSDSPSSSQSSSCEPLYQVFVPYTGWASYYASGAVWVLYNDGTQLGVKANEKTMTFIDQDGSQRKYNNKDVVPDIIKMKLEKFPSILAAVLNSQR